jgi:3-oxoacyl-[acyl-carrier protein] reductase
MMDLGLSGRTALVCASTGGLGEAIAQALAEEGAHTVICGRRADRAKEIAAWKLTDLDMTELRFGYRS